MGIFDKMFKSERDIAKEEIKKVPWKEITGVEMLEEISQGSHERPAVILKHSTSCGISRMVLRQFEMDYNIEPEKVDLYFLDLLRYREISNKIASRFNVPHESPQLIILNEGRVIYDASHGAISVDGFKQHL
ncbi:MAG TPA: bacillithiol system redox-active protein YtxJ [Gillisia sp.]|nr:bacillithiol system redox-active protein YtxJ [Gillisia sp.]